MRVQIVNNQSEKSVALTERFVAACPKYGIEIVEEDPAVIVSIGGDGTMLKAFHECQHLLEKVRFVGIHTGHLGFYTDWLADELEQLMEALSNDNGESISYPLLQVEVKFTDGSEEAIKVLNECVLRQFSGTMMGEVFIKEELFEVFRGDGLCVSTPTGSTGLNKSYGGTIIHPRNDVLQLTEMASINNRVFRTLGSSMVIAKDEWIEVHPFGERMDDMVLQVDNLPTINKAIESIRYSIAKERIHFARYRHMHFWDRVERAFIGAQPLISKNYDRD